MSDSTPETAASDSTAASAPVQLVETDAHALMLREEGLLVPKANGDEAVMFECDSEMDDSEWPDDSDDDDDTTDFAVTGDRVLDSARLSKLLDRPVVIDDEDVEDDEDDESVPRTTHELAEFPAPEPFIVEESDELVPCGTVLQCIDSIAIVQAAIDRSKSLETQTLDLGSALCLSDRTALGRVIDTFGPIQEPMYTVQLLNSTVQLDEGHPVFVVHRLCSYAAPDTSRGLWAVTAAHISANHLFAGCDASNAFDEELPFDKQEFSDDEMEAEAARQRRAAKQDATAAASGVLPNASKPKQRRPPASQPAQPLQQPQSQQQRPPLPMPGVPTAFGTLPIPSSAAPSSADAYNQYLQQAHSAYYLQYMQQMDPQAHAAYMSQYYAYVAQQQQPPQRR